MKILVSGVSAWKTHPTAQAQGPSCLSSCSTCCPLHHLDLSAPNSLAIYSVSSHHSYLAKHPPQPQSEDSRPKTSEHASVRENKFPKHIDALSRSRNLQRHLAACCTHDDIFPKRALLIHWTPIPRLERMYDCRTQLIHTSKKNTY